MAAARPARVAPRIMSVCSHASALFGWPHGSAGNSIPTGPARGCSPCTCSSSPCQRVAHAGRACFTPPGQAARTGAVGGVGRAGIAPAFLPYLYISNACFGLVGTVMFGLTNAVSHATANGTGCSSTSTSARPTSRRIFVGRGAGPGGWRGPMGGVLNDGHRCWLLLFSAHAGRRRSRGHRGPLGLAGRTSS